MTDEILNPVTILAVDSQGKLRPVRSAKSSDGSDAGLVVAEIINRPLDNTLKRAFNLDSTAANEYIITDFEKFSNGVIKVSGILATETISIQGDLSADQSGAYTNKVAGFNISGATKDAGGLINLVNGTYRIPDMHVFTALRIYVSTVDAAGGVVSVNLNARGLAQ